MDNTKALKDIQGYKKIYIKRDTHPSIRKEHARLIKKEKAEKEKPGNVGIEIKYDRKRRVLLRAGDVIDKFNPSFQ